MSKEILDACCGGKMFWYDKDNDDALFMDIREVDDMTLCGGRTFRVKPDVVADFRDMPFENDKFRLVIFDPPHLKQAGEGSYMALKYGKLDTDNWQDDLRRGFAECWRVLKPGGTLIFKWSEAQIPKSEVAKLYPSKPVIGNRRDKTHWVVFYKSEEVRE